MRFMERLRMGHAWPRGGRKGSADRPTRVSAPVGCGATSPAHTVICVAGRAPFSQRSPQPRRDKPDGRLQPLRARLAFDAEPYDDPSLVPGAVVTPPIRGSLRQAARSAMRQALDRTARLVRALRRRPGLASPPGGSGTGPATSTERAIEDCARYGGGLAVSDPAPDWGRIRYPAHDMST